MNSIQGNLVALSLVMLVVAAGFAVAACNGEEAKKPPPPPPPTVYVTTITRRDVPLYIEQVGAVDGYVNAEIRARVKGYLKTQDYKDGEFVKAGHPLFSIESTDYAAAVASARAAVTRAAVARDHNKTQAERYTGLFKTGMVSQQDLDNVTSSVADADAQVESAQAQLAQANLNLSYVTMKSPIDGVAGLALVRVGNLVGQDGPTLLTTVSQLDPVRVNFPVSEVDYVKNPDRFKQLSTRDLAWAKKQFALIAGGGVAENGDPGVELVLSDGTVFGQKGVIVSVDRQIDSSTGTIQVQALFPNADNALRPGQYGRVRIKRQETGHDVLAVPEKALIPVQGKYSLGVVGADNKVQMRQVEVGPSVQGLRLVTSGIAEGDVIVVDGIQKISDGAPVNPQPAPPASAPAAGAASPQGSAAPTTKN